MMVIAEKISETFSMSVSKLFSEGISQFYAGNLSVAAELFRSINSVPMADFDPTLSYSAENYLKAIQARLNNIEKSSNHNESIEMLAQMLLNKKASTEALDLLDKALPSNPQSATLYYLKAIAYVQLEREEESANALYQSIKLNGDFLFKFRLEPDFDQARNSEWFLSMVLD